MNIERFHSNGLDKKEMPNVDFIKQLREKINNKKGLPKENKQYTLDRYEGEYAVLEDRENKEMIDVAKEKLPADTAEGDILDFRKGEFHINHEATEQAKDEVRALMQELKKKTK